MCLHLPVLCSFTRLLRSEVWPMYRSPGFFELSRIWVKYMEKTCHWKCWPDKKVIRRTRLWMTPSFACFLLIVVACQTKLRKMHNEFSPPSRKATADRLRIFTSFRSEVWWRRGESNPRPRIFHVGLYIHSPNLNFRPRDTFRARWLKSYPD